jgi:transposase
VAYGAHEHGAEGTCFGTMGTRPCDLDPLIRKMHAKAKQLLFVDAAGACGSWLSRDLHQQGDACGVVAPAWLPTTPGERVTSDRQDARPLARLARAGALTVVDVPTGADDARRALTRARADTRRALKAATCRLNAFLRRHESRDPGWASGGPAHLRWLADVGCPTPAPHSVFQADGRAITDHSTRLPHRDQARHAQVAAWRLQPVGTALQALRGGQVTAAVTMVAERGALPRVERPRARLECLGLIPSESTSAARRRHGAMTQAGHPQARRALLEGAWASRAPAKVRRHLQRRLEPPQSLQDLRWQAQVRRCQRSRPLLARGNHATVVPGAMARALAGCLGAMAQQVPVTPAGQARSPGHDARSRRTKGPRTRRRPEVVAPAAA